MPAKAISAALLVSAFAGCSDVAGSTPPQDARGRYVITSGNATMWMPVEARVPVGSTVVWTNGGGIVHDVSGYVGDPVKEDYPQFHTGYGELLEPGEEFEHTFNSKGTWTIWCHTHHEEGMKGILHVE